MFSTDVASCGNYDAWLGTTRAVVMNTICIPLLKRTLPLVDVTSEASPFFVTTYSNSTPGMLYAPTLLWSRGPTTALMSRT